MTVVATDEGYLVSYSCSGASDNAGQVILQMRENRAESVAYQVGDLYILDAFRQLQANAVSQGVGADDFDRRHVSQDVHG